MASYWCYTEIDQILGLSDTVLCVVLTYIFRFWFNGLYFIVLSSSDTLLSFVMFKVLLCDLVWDRLLGSKFKVD